MKIKNNNSFVIAGFLILITITGCDDIISSDVNEEFFIEPGHRAEIRESGLAITFNKVVEDSRCPIGVECVWAGNGKVEVTIHFPGSEDMVQVLNTNLDPKEIKAGEYRISFWNFNHIPWKARKLCLESTG